MRRVIGYADGKAIWSDNVPAAAFSNTIRGSLVVGGPASESLYIPTNHEAARVAAKKAASRAEYQKLYHANYRRVRDNDSGRLRRGEPCGEPMRVAMEPCARRKGHMGHHRSSASMKREREYDAIRNAA